MEKYQYWSEDKRHDYEIKKLSETLKTAYTKTFYYKKLFDECGFDINTFHYFDQMWVIPYLTKNLIQDHIQEMVNSEISPKDYQYMTTGGSTGIPMGFYTMNRDALKKCIC